MLKKLFTVAAAAMLAFSAQAARFEAGEDYQVLDLPKSDTPTVTEFFSFYCPHCFQSQPLMEALKENTPDNTSFTKNHVSFMGGNMGSALSKAYATAMMLDVEDKIVPVIFNRIHLMQKPPRNQEELRQLFIDEGVDAEKFDGTYNSFAANAMANRFDKAFSDSGLRGVPAVIVNGKYHVTPKTIKTKEDYFALVNFLLTQ
ncbi:thiol:disulfide interchange protein DsbA/DsbL [Grimontia hollisae]|uniref:Thiol:disulfide interchange protein n=2 Tax=Grimontia hollisae TaxID=673 RepID=D0I2V6_GRIHO|nr:thiol:disulfide interchange protein DsbA/DsbL [Grimontia hollisae]AMG30633.1 thiol:disulfide interchange protein DsbA/DsbL [Grimontia hollisae]EEY74156.1 periplasmic thiol:disulfide interchange protein DsbA [Grimontia hollisae CIP 101886]MDF2183605.1 thiol:disulfide interchange protein DsbA/DsbL [Grimontia hollisae]STO47749.1 Thiol:disulfide interchange protein DsbA precursor [Grimontia hollisae]STO58549.1 Thiol:disulfide interchange protein DsbA precursor [Grimontia hollisae]